jgi:hypothetical protein
VNSKDFEDCENAMSEKWKGKSENGNFPGWSAVEAMEERGLESPTVSECWVLIGCRIGERRILSHLERRDEGKLSGWLRGAWIFETKDSGDGLFEIELRHLKGEIWLLGGERFEGDWRDFDSNLWGSGMLTLIEWIVVGLESLLSSFHFDGSCPISTSKCQSQSQSWKNQCLWASTRCALWFSRWSSWIAFIQFRRFGRVSPGLDSRIHFSGGTERLSSLASSSLDFIWIKFEIDTD